MFYNKRCKSSKINNLKLWMIYTFSTFFMIISIMTYAWPAGIIKLPATGQNKCYDSDGNEIECTGTGQDGETQSGIPFPTPRFVITYGDTNGPCDSQSSDCDNDASTDIITDNLTGLVWARYAYTCDSWTEWSEALTFANDLVLCGFDDWRLPNITELDSLINTGEVYPSNWLFEHGFDVSGLDYWSSTSYPFSQNNPNMVWDMNYDGYLGVTFKSMNEHLRPVRGGQQHSPDPSYPSNIRDTGQTACYDDDGNEIACPGTGQDGEMRWGVDWPSPRFTDNNDGTVTDNLTGLMWLKDANSILTQYPGFDTDGTSDGGVNWQHALDFVAGINNGTYPNCSAGFTDWRLPNKNELFSLVDFSQGQPAIQAGHPFVNIQNDMYWTSTTWAEVTDQAWIVDMYAGDVYTDYKSGSSDFVWPVRLGTSGNQDNEDEDATPPADNGVDDTAPPANNGDENTAPPANNSDNDGGIFGCSLSAGTPGTYSVYKSQGILSGIISQIIMMFIPFMILLSFRAFKRRK